MRGLIFGMAALLLLASPGTCQVDTLRLVEIGSIEAPAEITELYVEDLDGDSLKEIILTTASNVHIYDGITYEEIWTSPELVNPQDLLFEDINLDGLIDFSVKDTTNIHLFDPHNDTVIWTSPAIDSTYNCYTIGDRFSDGIIDFALVCQTSSEIPDTATFCIKLYETQSFTLVDSFCVDMLWIVEDPGNYSKNSPIDIFFEKMQNNLGYVETIILASKYMGRYENGGFFSWRRHGDIYIYDASSFALIREGETGELLKGLIYNYDGQNRIYYTVGTFDWGMGEPYPTSEGGFGLDMFTIDSSYNILNYTNYYPGAFQFAIGEILADNEGPELYFYHSFWSIVHFAAYSMLDCEFLWLNDSPPGIRKLAQNAFIDYSLFDSPELAILLNSSILSFYNAENGNCDAVVVWTNIRPIVDDLDADNISEIVEIDGIALFIYRLADPTAISGHENKNIYILSAANYPNPFNSATTIEYGLPQAGHVTVEVYDLLGRRVETLLDEEQEGGQHHVVWDAGDRSSGVYFYRIAAGEFTETRRMVLLK